MSSTDGHTLMEMLIVLAVLSVMTMIPILHFQSLHEKKSTDYFIDLLEEDLRSAQQLAYANEEWIYFQETEEEYHIRRGSIYEEPIKKRTIPPGIYFRRSTLDFDSIGFKSNGNARKAGTVFIETPNGSYKLVVLVGKGRVYIEKR
ncbi:competence type IV pilus minor pilin ComGD [Salibacterium aidingense]|uniref:competence type IV pilus minor pilin ComGD n=1 Tax=Salibacterium aidingense TaxID=384933 RepID=UPI0022772709